MLELWVRLQERDYAGNDGIGKHPKQKKAETLSYRAHTQMLANFFKVMLRGANSDRLNMV